MHVLGLSYLTKVPDPTAWQCCKPPYHRPTWPRPDGCSFEACETVGRARVRHMLRVESRWATLSIIIYTFSIPHINGVTRSTPKP